MDLTPTGFLHGSEIFDVAEKSDMTSKRFDCDVKSLQALSPFK